MDSSMTAHCQRYLLIIADMLLLLKTLYYDDNSQNCISLCKANKRSIYLSIYTRSGQTGLPGACVTEKGQIPFKKRLNFGLHKINV